MTLTCKETQSTFEMFVLLLLIIQSRTVGVDQEGTNKLLLNPTARYDAAWGGSLAGCPPQTAFQPCGVVRWAVPRARANG